MNQALDKSSIADLSYRNYDGPISPPNRRWWVIARQMILRAVRLKSLWILTIFSGWYFIVMIVILFFLQQAGSSNPSGQQLFQSYVNGIVWKDQFLHGFGYSQHLLLVATLILGAGSIANDNRSNALLVYLSKPCKKTDYLIGKWIGLFVPILIVVTLPSLAFYAYGIFSFRDQGFFRADPYLLLKVLALMPLAAAAHTSLILAASSLFKQGTVAGAVYAGVYFMGYFFTLLMQAIWVVTAGKASTLIINLYYCSIDGLQIGLAKAILQPAGTRPFGIPARGIPAIPAPALAPHLLILAAISIGCIWFTWTRIRAVEVV